MGSAVRMLRFPVRSDARGGLLPIDFADLPFQPRRVFFATASDAGTTRGGHAHRRCQQLLMSLRGTIDVSLAFRDQEAMVRLDVAEKALYLAPFVWSEQTFVTADAQLVALMSDPYDEADYLDRQQAVLAGAGAM